MFIYLFGPFLNILPNVSVPKGGKIVKRFKPFYFCLVGLGSNPALSYITGFDLGRSEFSSFVMFLTYYLGHHLKTTGSLVIESRSISIFSFIFVHHREKGVWDIPRMI